jgi:hypothetical protein
MSSLDDVTVPHRNLECDRIDFMLTDDNGRVL